ncbi:MAG: gamma-glutamylcyclotransferase family protein [Acidimicrobiia bacterium]|nr:gamma-glutamylcyclotransferase family protein [Acidimicrobiia bacterium]
MKNFAYGSNLCRDRLVDRVSTAHYEFVAHLPSYELRFHKRSDIDGSAKADAFFTGDADDTVWGVVVDVPDLDRWKLDQAEGLGGGYAAESVTVFDGEGDPHQAVAYIAQQSHIDPRLRPYEWYLSLVVDGARARGLPETYVEEIESVRAIPDPEPERPYRPPDDRLC